jgi:hypothetical protein
VPIKLSALTADRRRLNVHFDSGELNIVYRPSAINAVQEARENEQREKGENLKSQAHSLVEILTSWDLEDDDGQPVPITHELMETLGMEFTRTLTRAVLDDLLPNRTPPATSSNGS